MKVAIVHDWLTSWGGSEQVLAHLFQCFPDARLFATIDFLDEGDRIKLGGRTATTTFVQKLPFARKFFWNYLTLMPLAVEQHDLDEFDLVISSSHAFAKGVLTRPGQVHVSYVHSPMRYAWDLQHEYLRDSREFSGIKGMFARLGLHYLRMWDQRTANGVDAFAVNSSFIRERVWRTYRREAAVIHPPVDLDFFSPGGLRKPFYLCASRLVSYKRVDLVVKAFAAMPERRLVVIGDGPERRTIEKIRPPNVELLGYQPADVLREHLRETRALVFAACEDFGILPVEAQACGTPVIAYGRGGALETVVGLGSTNPTGVYFAQQRVDSVRQAITEFEHAGDAITPEACRANALRFDKRFFAGAFREFVARAVEEQCQRTRVPRASVMHA